MEVIVWAKPHYLRYVIEVFDLRWPWRLTFSTENWRRAIAYLASQPYTATTIQERYRRTDRRTDGQLKRYVIRAVKCSQSDKSLVSWFTVEACCEPIGCRTTVNLVTSGDFIIYFLK